jgi:hypothetical protein
MAATGPDARRDADVAVMTGERIAWAPVTAVLGAVLVSIGQVSPDLPVFMLQVVSSAALAALVTCGIRLLWDAVAAPAGSAEAAPGPEGGTS